MMPFRSWARPPRNLIALFLTVTLLSVIALVWLGLRLMEQDRALEAQRLQERREGAADRIVTSLEQALSASERRLANPAEWRQSPPPGDALIVAVDANGIRAYPENRLLYYPVAPVSPEAPAALFREGEDYEFRQRDYPRAIASFRGLSASRDPAVRAGARLRLARNLRKAGRQQDALEAYRALAELETASVAGVPAELVARRARCALLEELERTADLRREAGALYADLRKGRWRLDRSAYLHYAGQLSRWLGVASAPDPEQEALAAAADWIWRKWADIGTGGPGATGRQSLRMEGVPLTLLWQATADRLVALVAGPGYQKREWFDRISTTLDLRSIQAALVGAEDQPAYGSLPPKDSVRTERAASVTGLPWTVVVTNADVRADLDQFALRRRLLLAGLGVLAVLVIASSYFIGRAISRELAVARLQSDFVSAVSHEFRTPLTSLRQFTELLTDNDDLPGDKRRTFYKGQARATERLHRLVESLLDFGRMEAGARPYRLERMDAGNLVNTVVEEFKNETAGRGFTVECVHQADRAIVNGDADALSRALWNLLDNAMKYSGESRTIWVELAREAGQVAIRVRDKGFGIPQSEQKEIFRKFTRGIDAKAQSIKGTGIGLAMVRHIVDAHGGKIALESAPGEGSTFTILLPAGG